METKRIPIVTSLDPLDFAQGTVTGGPSSTNVLWSQYADQRSYATQRPAVEVTGIAGERGFPAKGRGIVYWDKVAGEASNGIYFVNDNIVYAGSYDNPITNQEITTGRDPIHFVEVGNFLVLLDAENNQGWYIDGAAPEQLFRITAGAFPGIQNGAQLAGGGAELDGFLYVLDTDGVIYNSNINDVTQWSALDFLEAQREQDAGVYLTKHHDNIVALGSNSTEFFYNAGNPVGSPLQRRPDISYRTGALDRKTVFTSGERIYFIGSEKIGTPSMYEISGYQLAKVSNDSIDRFIAQTRVTEGYELSMTGGYIGEHYLTFINTLNPTAGTGQTGNFSTFEQDLTTNTFVSEINPMMSHWEIQLSPDGTKMFTVEQASTLHEYNLSTPFDITTAVASGVTFTIATNANSLYVRPDGNRFYVAEIIFNTAGKVHEYSMSNWDLSTAATTGVTYSPFVTGGHSAISFKPDGTRMFLTAAGDITQYDLGTAWNITTASLIAGVVDLKQAGGDANFDFNSDGTAVYEMSDSDTVSSKLWKYPMTVPYDLSTAGPGELQEDSLLGSVLVYRGNGSYGLHISPITDNWYVADQFGYIQHYNYNRIETVTPVFGPVEGYEPVFTMYYDAGVQLWGTFDTDISGVQAFGMAGISERSAILRGESTILFMSGDLAVFNNDGSTLDTSGEGQYVDDDYTITQAAWVTGGIAQETANIPISITLNESDFGSLTNKFMYRFGVVGTTVGQVTDVTPLLVSWTDDTYRTFTNVRFYDTDHRRILTQLGKFKRRAFKLDYNGEERLRLEELEFTLDGSEFA